MVMLHRHPCITQDGPDWSPGDPGEPPKQYIANGTDGLVAGFKYFDLSNMKRMTIRVRGSAKGSLLIRTAPQGELLAEIHVTPSKEWTAYTAEWSPYVGVHPLYLCYQGKGKLDILDFFF